MLNEVVHLEIRGIGDSIAKDVLAGEVIQASGDEAAGFYCAVSTPSHGRQVEVYDWSHLVAGRWRAAVWWTLFPFTLINAAGWMFQPQDAELAHSDEHVRSSLWFARLFLLISGIGMTAFYVIGLVAITTEIVVIGCAAEPSCGRRGYMVPLTWFGQNAVWLVALGVGLAAVLILSLFVFVLRQQEALEGYETDAVRRLIAVAEDRRADSSRLRRNTRMQDQSFWYRWAEHRRLVRLHLDLTVLLLGAAAGHAIAINGWEGPPGAGWLAICAVVLLLVGMLWHLSGLERVREPAIDDSGSLKDDKRRILWMLAHIGAMVAGYTLAWGLTVWLTDPGRGFYYLDAIRVVTSVIYVATVITSLLLVHRRRVPSSNGTLWLLPVMSAGLAVLIAGAYFAGTSTLVGHFLLGEEWGADSGYSSAAVDILLASLATTFLFVGFKVWRTPPPFRRVVDDYFPDKGSEELSENERKWACSIAGARRAAEAVEVQSSFAVLLVTAMSLALFQSWRGDFDFGPEGALARPLFGIAWLTVLGSLIPAIRLARGGRSGARRGGLADLWETFSFLPRRFQPLAAPCYAERAVPEFRDRIRYHLSKGSRVVVSAHGQGSVVAFAALLQICAETDSLPSTVDGFPGVTYREITLRWPREPGYKGTFRGHIDDMVALDEYPLRKVGLITVGSPLNLQYGRLYPRHFGTAGRLQELRDALAILEPSGTRAWRNVYRPTDSLGREIFAETGGTLDPADCSADVRVKEARNALFPHEFRSNYDREPGVRDTIELFAFEIP